MSCCQLSAPDVTALNANCDCRVVTRSAIDRTLCAASQTPYLAEVLAERPGLFASTEVFLAPETRASIATQITAIEAVFGTPEYRAQIAARTDDPAFAAQPGMAGLLMGYDFHVSPDGPRLIEINTNAGGAFLIAALEGKAATLVAMVRSEWRRAGRTGLPARLAIVDEEPAAQYLYPDMILARDMLAAAGIETVVADAADLTFDGALTWRGQPVDMVYNRLTDFTLSSHPALRQTLLTDRAVISPAPRHHALYADKRNLAVLSDPAFLNGLDLPASWLATLAELPEVTPVEGETAPLWEKRRHLFFKPVGGFGSRGVYRGDKLTRRVWEDISAGGYVAQTYVPPALRAAQGEQGVSQLKYDLRAYVYAGEILMFAARLYQGQATNFRTSGGGLARVVAPPCC